MKNKNHGVRILWISVLLPMVAWAQSNVASSVDLKDREFKSEEIVRALAPRDSKDATATSLPVRRTRGLGVVQMGASGPANIDPHKRSVSMQLQFNFDSAQLTDGALVRLDAVGEALLAPELREGRFLISGHTDAKGRYDYNLGLSKRRAEAVRDYLVQRHGVEFGRLVTVGKGSDELADSRDPVNAVNRRVQIDALN